MNRFLKIRKDSGPQPQYPIVEIIRYTGGPGTYGFATFRLREIIIKGIRIIDKKGGPNLGIILPEGIKFNTPAEEHYVERKVVAKYLKEVEKQRNG